MKIGRAAWAGLGLVVATCLPLDERTIDEQTGGSSATGGKGGGGKAGSGDAGAEDAGGGGDLGGAGAGDSGGGSGGSSGTAGKAATGGAGGSSASGGSSGVGAQGGAGGSSGSGGASGSAGTGGAGGAQGGSAGSSGAGTSGGGSGGDTTCGTVEAGWDIDATYLTGVTGATDIAFHADGRAVVTQKSGSVTVRRTDGTKNILSGKFGTVNTASEKGLLGVVADPNPTTNAFYFYVSNGTTTADKHRVFRGTLDASDDITVDLVNPVIGVDRGNGPGLEGPANHDGGGLIVHEGQLYLSVGDTGANATPPTNKYSSCLNKGNGKILRVNLDGSIPSDNPLVGVGMVSACTSTSGAWTMAAPDQRIFAWGLRNPWRFWIDPVTELLWIGDVGETTREEISIGTGNQHYGYPFNEGTTAWGDVDAANCSTLTPSRTCTGPVYDYGRTSGTGVIGGLIPEGCGWSNVWSGALYYLFGDYTGPIRALQVRPDRTGLSVPPAAIDLENPGGAPASFRMGPDESLYIVLNGAGAVFRYTPKSRCGADCN